MNILGGYIDFVKILLTINIFGGMKILWIFYWGRHKIGLYLRVISIHFRVFLISRYRMGDISLDCLSFKKKMGCLKFLKFFRGMVNNVPEPMFEVKIRVPL